MKPIFCFFALALALAMLPPIHAQTSKTKSKGIPIEQLEQQLRAAKRPKSDKWRFSLLPVGLQINPQVEYVIVTEMTNAGRKLPDPSFDKPVYYIAHSQGQQDAGEAHGNARDVQFEYLRKHLNAALVSNGYHLYDPEQPDKAPTQVLFFTWGRHNRKNMAPSFAKIFIEKPSDDPDEFELGELARFEVPPLRGGVNVEVASNDDSNGEIEVEIYDRKTKVLLLETLLSVATDEFKNLLARAKIVGGQKFAEEFEAVATSQLLKTPGKLNYDDGIGPLCTFSSRDEITPSLLYMVFNDSYYMVVSSYDLEALKSKQRKLLWTTRISTTARGVSFEQTLPIMIQNGAYFFGRETNGPEILLKRAYKRATVEIGDPEVVDYISGTATGNSK
jgi:hypothetical protein